jgi:glutamate carboxypeptidase
VESESPTWDAAPVDRMLDLAARDMAIAGATIERIAWRGGFGGCVRAFQIRAPLSSIVPLLR